MHSLILGRASLRASPPKTIRALRERSLLVCRPPVSRPPVRNGKINVRVGVDEPEIPVPNTDIKQPLGERITPPNAYRCEQPGQQHGRRIPSLSSEHTLSTCCRLVSSFLTEMVQQIHSLRASGVMSSQAASAFASDASAFRRSAGRLCTTPPENRMVVIVLSRRLKVKHLIREYNLDSGTIVAYRSPAPASRCWRLLEDQKSGWRRMGG
jgi:hypothetical protein